MSYFRSLWNVLLRLLLSTAKATGNLSIRPHLHYTSAMVALVPNQSLSLFPILIFTKRFGPQVIQRSLNRIISFKWTSSLRNDSRHHPAGSFESSRRIPSVISFFSSVHHERVKRDCELPRSRKLPSTCWYPEAVSLLGATTTWHD
jgi:hypothetical protein